jgi:hypothetical protein
VVAVTRIAIKKSLLNTFRDVRQCVPRVIRWHGQNCLRLCLNMNEFNAGESSIELKTYMWIKCKSGFMKCQF